MPFTLLTFGEMTHMSQAEQTLADTRNRVGERKEEAPMEKEK